MELTSFPHVLFQPRDTILCFQFWQVFLGHRALALSFVLQFGGTFRLLRIHRSKILLLLFKLFLDLDGILVCRAEGGDVQEFYFFLDALVQAAMVFQYQMLL